MKIILLFLNSLILTSTLHANSSYLRSPDVRPLASLGMTKQSVKSLALLEMTKLNILTTTTDLASIVKEVAGDFAKVDSICKGTQDPHYIEPKPSYMVKARDADLIVAIGLSLEIGWLPSVIRGARNPKIDPGSSGYIEVGPLVNPLEKLEGSISRAQGDVHPDGNPHITLDPVRDGEIAIILAKTLGRIDEAHADMYEKNAKFFQKRLLDKIPQWQNRIDQSGVKKVISFHKTLTYFFNRFKIENTIFLEPLPGIPPTPKHTIEVIDRAKKEKISLIMVENFFTMDAANRVASEIPGMRAAFVPVSVGGEDNIKSIDDLMETLVQVIEGKKKL